MLKNPFFRSHSRAIKKWF